MRKIKKGALLVVCIVSTCLCGCATKEIDVEATTLFVNKNGSITDAIVEDFNESYYNATEMQAMLNTELAAYNQSVNNESAAVISKFEVLGGVAKVFIDFASSIDYATFNEKVFFVGTVNEAYEQGYELDVTMKNVNGDEILKKADILEKGKYKIVILEEHINVVLYKKILYTSANVEMINDKQAKISEEAEGLAYIIYK